MTNKTDWVNDIHEMHTKFGVREVIEKLPKDKLSAFLNFRLNFLQEELDEAKKAESADDIVDAMIDLCVVAIGTLDAFQVDAYEAWNRVHTANMAKEPGIKPERPNPLGLPDLIKPAGWTAPTHVDNVGLVAKLFDREVKVERDKNGLSVFLDGERLMAKWSPEAAESLAQYHNLDIEKEIAWGLTKVAGLTVTEAAEVMKQANELK